MADSQTIATLHALVSEDGKNVVTQQARLTCGLVDIPLPEGEKYRPAPTKERYSKPITCKTKAQMVGTVQTKKGVARSGGVTTDGATRRTGSAVQFFKGTYDFKIYENNLELPMGLTMVARGGEGIDYCMEQLKTLGSQVGVDIDQLVDGKLLDPPDATVSAAAVTFTVADPSGYVEGEE